jgi:hypothetical protein
MEWLERHPDAKQRASSRGAPFGRRLPGWELGAKIHRETGAGFEAQLQYKHKPPSAVRGGPQQAQEPGARSQSEALPACCLLPAGEWGGGGPATSYQQLRDQRGQRRRHWPAFAPWGTRWVCPLRPFSPLPLPPIAPIVCPLYPLCAHYAHYGPLWPMMPITGHFAHYRQPVFFSVVCCVFVPRGWA